MRSDRSPARVHRTASPVNRDSTFLALALVLQMMLPTTNRPLGGSFPPTRSLRNEFFSHMTELLEADPSASGSSAPWALTLV